MTYPRDAERIAIPDPDRHLGWEWAEPPADIKRHCDHQGRADQATLPPAGPIGSRGDVLDALLWAETVERHEWRLVVLCDARGAEVHRMYKRRRK